MLNVILGVNKALNRLQVAAPTEPGQYNERVEDAIGIILGDRPDMPVPEVKAALRGHGDPLVSNRAADWQPTIDTMVIGGRARLTRRSGRLSLAANAWHQRCVV